MTSYYPITAMNPNKSISVKSPITKKPLTIEDLDKIQTYEDRQNLLMMHNAVFYQTIMNTIAAKNKLDFPPTGPIYDSSKSFQNKKIQLLLQAILEKNTSPSGLYTKYPLGNIGLLQSSISGARTIASKGMGIGRYFSPTKKGGKSIKNIDSYKKKDLEKIAKTHELSFKNKDGKIKTKEELYKSLKRKKFI
jgi:hypothetical protein